MAEERKFGTGKGDVYPATAAWALTLHRRHGRPGYTAVFVKDSGGSRLGS